MLLIRRMPFPVKETFKNSFVVEPFQLRFEIPDPDLVLDLFSPRHPGSGPYREDEGGVGPSRF